MTSLNDYIIIIQGGDNLKDWTFWIAMGGFIFALIVSIYNFAEDRNKKINIVSIIIFIVCIILGIVRLLT